MKVSLKDPKTPVWNLPGTEVSLNLETPELEIDLKLLGSTNQIVLWNSISHGILGADNTDELKKLVFPEVKVPLPRALKTSLTEQSISFEETRTKELKDLIDKSVSTLKKELPSKSMAELNILNGLEKDSKNRKSVYALIRELIGKHAQQVYTNASNKIVSPENKKKHMREDLKGIPFGMRPESLEVIEELETDKKITFKMSS